MSLPKPPHAAGPSVVARRLLKGVSPLEMASALAQLSFTGAPMTEVLITPLPTEPKNPPSRILYCPPATTGKVIPDCRPQLSSLHASCVPVGQPIPSYAASVVSYRLPHVLIEAVPVDGEVKLYQMSLPKPPHAAGPSVDDPALLNGVAPTASGYALAQSSFPGIMLIVPVPESELNPPTRTLYVPPAVVGKLSHDCSVKEQGPLAPASSLQLICAPTGQPVPEYTTTTVS